jgi:hypothetical protein
MDYSVLKVESVRPVASVPVRCIEVGNPSHLYLAGRSMIPTHNSTLGLDIARCAAIKHDMAAVVFSLEMSRTEITMRLLSAEAGVQLTESGHIRVNRVARTSVSNIYAAGDCTTFVPLASVATRTGSASP